VATDLIDWIAASAETPPREDEDGIKSPPPAGGASFLKRPGITLACGAFLLKRSGITMACGASFLKRPGITMFRRRRVEGVAPYDD